MSEQRVNFNEVHRAFAATDFGAELQANVRYERYKPLEMSNEAWVNLLGSDVGNLSHLKLTLGLGTWFVNCIDKQQPGRLTQHQGNVLLAACISHDWAESVKPDISYSIKTEADELEEAEAFIENLQAFYSGPAAELIAEAVEKVVLPGEPNELRIMFNAIERIGYLRTGLRASSIVQSKKSPEALQQGLTWLSSDVISNQPSKLTEYADNLPPVQTYLQAKRDEIDAAFGLVVAQPTIYDLEPKPVDILKRKGQFTINLIDWGQWKTENQATAV